MPTVATYNQSGVKVGEIQLNDAVFGVEVNEAIQHVSESPNRGECHEGQGVPVDFLGVFHKKPSFDIKLYLSA
jgi:ribosomal protein L4